ncbi:MAG: putative ORFan [Satyrvirus sp.]|uniref:Putative ORFan n=1 Tax=Satyrvirus sp. TaxID=2487771 RepID=A0A3G5AGV1_9VIRU|nr:MAG: putative ORFan [Satyrvirus sp.]
MNPYFSGDDLRKSRTRYDKIFCTDIFSCTELDVIKPEKNNKLVHIIYPYGNLSDHYPVTALLELN